MNAFLATLRARLVATCIVLISLGLGAIPLNVSQAQNKNEDGNQPAVHSWEFGVENQQSGPDSISVQVFVGLSQTQFGSTCWAEFGETCGIDASEAPGDGNNDIEVHPNILYRINVNGGEEQYLFYNCINDQTYTPDISTDGFFCPNDTGTTGAADATIVYHHPDTIRTYPVSWAEHTSFDEILQVARQNWTGA